MERFHNHSGHLEPAQPQAADPVMNVPVAETQRVLEHMLQVPPDSTSSIDEVLGTLQKHIEESSNKALR